MDRRKIRWKTRFRGPFLQRRPLTSRKIAIVMHHNTIFYSVSSKIEPETVLLFAFVCGKRPKTTTGVFVAFTASSNPNKNLSKTHF